MTNKFCARYLGRGTGVALLLGAAASAWAQEGAAKAGTQSLPESLGIDVKTIAVQLFAFVLLFLLFKKFLWGPVLGMLDTRQHEVSGLYSEAEAARQAADTARRDYEARLSRAEEESRARINEALAQAAAMKDEIITAARTESERIVTSGRETVRQETEKALSTVRDEAARVAVELAGKIIHRSMDASAHSALIDDFINNAGAGRPQ